MLMRSERVLIALAFFTSVVWGVSAWRIERRLPNAVQKVASAALGVAQSDVVVGSIGVTLLGTVRFDELRAATRLSIEHGVISFDGGGALVAEGIVYGALSVGHLRVDRLTKRVVADRVAFHALGNTLSAQKVAIEIEPTGARGAFSGATAGPIGELAGTFSRRGGLAKLKASTKGLELDVSAGKGRSPSVAIRFDRFLLHPLAKIARAYGVILDTAVVSGHVDVALAGHDVALDTDLSFTELGVDHAAVSTASLDHLSSRVSGHVAFHDGRITTDRFQVSVGAITGTVSGGLDRKSRALEVTFSLPTTPCPAFLASLPSPIVRNLVGLELTGSLSATATLALSLDHLDDPILDFVPEISCRVVTDAPRAEIAALKTSAPVMQLPGDRTLELGPKNPSFRAYAHIPERIVRVFLAAEDARFFTHHGFNLERIRRALGTDLSQGQVARGASTISQQVVKNLFLTGERTFARKLEEAVLTWRMEQLIPKTRILELYLNLVELGPELHGIKDAAQHYFHKRLEQLTEDEVARLAALLPAPRRGMDDAWHKRYEALIARLPKERIVMPRRAPKNDVLLTLR